MQEKTAEHQYISAEELSAQAKDFWNTLKDKEIKMKDRTGIPVQDMPVLEPQERARSMEEVAIGYTDEQARIEAER